MKRKQCIAILLAITTMTALLTGCGGKSGQLTKTEEEDKSIYTEVGTYPILNEGEELKISAFAPLRTNVTSLDGSENAATEWLETKTGLKFDFQTSLEVDAEQKMNTIMVSGELPDVFIYSPAYPITPSEQLLYGTQGNLIPLNDLIDKYMPNLSAMLEEDPYIKECITMTDGNIYVLPQIGCATHSLYSQKMWMNTTWLKNVGMELPTTTDEFYEVLKAFKEQDANGNGDTNDEVPLSGWPSGWATNPTVFLMNAFVPYTTSTDNTQGIYIDESGELVFPKTTEQWREGLRYLNKLYSEGLMDELTFTQTGQDLQKLGNNPDTTILGAAPGGSSSVFLSIGDSDRWREYSTVMPLKGPEGLQRASYVPGTGKAGLSITSECDSPEAVARAFDLFYTEEGCLVNRMGVEGTDFVLAEEGDVNFIGEPAKYTRISSAVELGNNAWAEAGPWGIPKDHDLWYSAIDNIEKVLYNETLEKYMPYTPPTESLLPVIAMTEEQSRIAVDIEVPMDQYISQATIQFITGEKDIEADWDTYVAEIEKLGLADYLEVYREVIGE